MTKEKRAVRLVQIAVAGVENNSSTQCNLVIVGLDERGRVWETDDKHPEWFLRGQPMEEVSDVF